jgi:hypothetical protein
MEQQTAVEWLVKQLFSTYEKLINEDIIEQAKAMEKEQIKDAYVECWKSNMPDGYECKQSADEYYIETYECEYIKSRIEELDNKIKSKQNNIATMLIKGNIYNDKNNQI